MALKIASMIMGIWEKYFPFSYFQLGKHGKASFQLFVETDGLW